MTLPKEWLEKAENDLSAAQKLYAIEDYGNAIFHLQQATEKLAKGQLRRFNLLRDEGTPLQINENFKQLAQTDIPMALGRDGYGHAWQEKFFNLIKNLILLSINKFPDLSVTLDSYNILLNKISEIPTSIDRNRLEELTNLIDEVIQILEMNSGDILKLSKSYGITSKEITDYIKAANIKTSTQINPFQLYTLAGLAIFGAILSPHESISRYPNDKIKVVYDKNLPIVEKFNNLYDELEYFKDFFKKSIN